MITLEFYNKGYHDFNKVFWNAPKLFACLQLTQTILKSGFWLDFACHSDAIRSLLRISLKAFAKHCQPENYHVANICQTPLKIWMIVWQLFQQYFLCWDIHIVILEKFFQSPYSFHCASDSRRICFFGMMHSYHNTFLSFDSNDNTCCIGRCHLYGSNKYKESFS